MGIPHYFFVIAKAYPDILRTACPGGCADYFLDFNGVIHQAVNASLGDLGEEAPADPEAAEALEKRMIADIWAYTERCVEIVGPNKAVHICVDGVAPVAKMMQQRKRRYLSVFKARLDETPVVWDRNAISPATPFMIRLHAGIQAAIRNRRAGLTSAYFYLSGADEPGEGEHKIFQRISGLEKGGDEPIVIHGLDADLIMLSLLAHTPHIFLMREPTLAGAAAGAAEEEAPFVYVSIDALRRGLLYQLRIVHGWDIPEAVATDPFGERACHFVEDYVALCFLLGNDFLPHPATLSLKEGGHDRLLQAARTAMEATGLRMTDGKGNIAWPFLAAVLRELTREEDTELWRRVEKYVKVNPRRVGSDGSPLPPSDLYPLRPENKDPLARELVGGGGASGGVAWRPLYYKFLFQTRLHDTKTTNAACKLFVQGIAWTLRYYKRMSKDPMWYYPYGAAPTFRDLANFVSGLTAADMEDLVARFTVPATSPAGFVDPVVQLLCIMPLESAPVLPKKVRILMGTPEHGCCHFFATRYPIQTFLKTHLWECHPILPVLDIPWIQQAVGRLK